MRFTPVTFVKKLPILLLAGALALFLWQTGVAQQIDNFTKLGNYGWLVSQKAVYTPAPDLNYLLFVPENHAAQIDGKFPLIVSLSGIGERGNDLNIVKNDGLPAKLDGWNDFPCMVVAPQCPETTQWYWDRTDTLIRRIIENVLAEHPADPDRVYLTGYSMGGIATWDMGARHPDLFAALLPIAARREPGTSFCNMRDIPAWAFHGANDQVVPLTAGRGAVNVFRACGGNVRFTVYPGVGHNSWTQTYANMDTYEWLLKQDRRKVNTVAALGNRVFFGRENELLVQQYDDAEQVPQTLARLPLPEPLNDLQIANGGNRLAALGANTFIMIDIADPQQPAVMSALGLNRAAGKLSLSGQFAFVATDSGLAILDITDAQQPALIAAIDTLGKCYDIFAGSHYAYLAAGEKSHIIDISNPAVPLYAGEISGFGSGNRAITAENSIAYIADEFSGLQIVDVSNPATPQGLAAVFAGQKFTDIHIRDTLAFLAAGDAGVKIVDVSDPPNPLEISEWLSPGRTLALSFGEIAANGQAAAHLFGADFSAGVRAVNITDPASPYESAVLDVSPPTGGGVAVGKAYRSRVVDGRAFIAYGWEGLKIVDVSNPQQPALLGKRDTPGDARDVFINGDFAYLADWDAGLRVMDISNPQQPQEITFLNTGRTRQIAVKDEFIYLAASDSGLLVLDISDAASPVISQRFPGYFGRAVAVEGSVAALAENHRVVFFDISDPAHPAETGASVPLLSGCEGLALSGSLVFIPEGDTLRIVDRGNPAAPQQLSKTALGAPAFDVAVQQNYVFVAAGDAGLLAYDVSDPHSPVPAGMYNGDPPARGVTVAENRVFVAEESGGLSIYRFDLLTGLGDSQTQLPERIVLAQNYPNPFNPLTTIAWQLPFASVVKLQIFNILGQEMKTLVDAPHLPGRYTAVWDGTDRSGRPAASGLYFYRLSAGDFVSVKKMLLLQ